MLKDEKNKDILESLVPKKNSKKTVSRFAKLLYSEKTIKKFDIDHST
jgi:hypothetical protein